MVHGGQSVSQNPERDASVLTLLLLQTDKYAAPSTQFARISILFQYRQRDTFIYHTVGTDRAPRPNTLSDRWPLSMPNGTATMEDEKLLDERRETQSVHNKKGRVLSLEYRTRVPIAFFIEHIVGSV